MEMNPNTPGEADRHVPKAIATCITELADGGLDIFEIQSVTGLALPLIRLVLRGGVPKEVTK
jgi:hypothetical protein